MLRSALVGKKKYISTECFTCISTGSKDSTDVDVLLWSEYNVLPEFLQMWRVINYSSNSVCWLDPAVDILQYWHHNWSLTRIQILTLLVPWLAGDRTVCNITTRLGRCYCLVTFSPFCCVVLGPEWERRRVLDLFRRESGWRIHTVPGGTVCCYTSQRSGIV